MEIRQKKITNYGYVKIRKLNHPYRDCDDFVFEHRLVAEEFLLNDENSIEIDGKKYLKPDFSVHHINENKTDNRVENLIVISKSEHMKIHSTQRAKKMARKVNKLTLQEKMLKTYNSIKEAGIENNISPQCITQVCRGKQQSVGGYLWKYSE